MAGTKPGAPAVWPQLDLARHSIVELAMEWHYPQQTISGALGAAALTGGFVSVTPYRSGGIPHRCDQSISRLLTDRSIWALEVVYESRGPWPGGSVPPEDRRGAEFATIAASLPPSDGMICTAMFHFSRNDAVLRTPVLPPWLTQREDANPVHEIVGLQGRAPATSEPPLPAASFSLTTTETERQLTINFVLPAEPIAASATEALAITLALAARVIPSLGGATRA
ncbi:MAG: hypothetical protein QM692_11685 [Thermomicrobiales bacterium]